MIDRRTTPARRVARARLSLGLWLGALIAITTIARSLVALLTFFQVEPLSGVLSSVWAVLGNGAIVVEWLLTAALVVVGIVAAARVRSVWSHQRARTAGWFIVVDTVVYVVSIAITLVVYREDAGEPLWTFLAVVVVANVALILMAAVVIRKATSLPRLQRDLLRWQYLRKPRLARTNMLF